MTIANQTQSAILEVFKDHFKRAIAQDSGNHIHTNKAEKIVCENVIPAEDDAGEWAPEAHAIIYHVNGMPSIDHIDKWAKVSAMLIKPPEWFYVEAINSEVSAVFNLR